MDVVAAAVCGLDTAAIHSWFSRALERLRVNQPVLNEANVYPVADADTGTNMYLTLRGGLRALESVPSPASPTDAYALVAQGAITSARGNSGIILSEYLRGFSQSATQATPQISPARQLADALKYASDRAFAAVAQPVEGTILTVARAAASAANALIIDDCGPVDVARAALGAGQSALEQSSLELGALARANVLDAGAYGLVIILSALESVLAGGEHRSVSGALAGERASLAQAPVAPAPVVPTPASQMPQVQASSPHTATGEAWGSDELHSYDRAVGSGPATDFDSKADDSSVDGEFEVMYLVRAHTHGTGTDQFSVRLRGALADLGESVVVVGGDTSPGEALWNVHVHTDTPDLALKAAETVAVDLGIEHATLSRVLVRDLLRQVTNAGGPQSVICTASPGLAPDLARGGAVVLLARDGRATLSDVSRGRSEAEGDGTMIVVNSVELRQQVQDAYPTDHVIVAGDDARVVAVATAMTLAASGGEPPRGPAELAAHLQEVADLAATWRFDQPTREALRTLILGEVPPRPGAIPIVTILADERCPVSLLTDLHAGVEGANPEAELITLGSGRKGHGLTMSIEWVEQ